MDSFQVGEQAIYFNPGDRLHKMDVLITGPLKEWFWRIDETGERGCSYCYRVEIDGGDSALELAEPCELRKKNPPKDEDRYTGNDVISWDDERSVWKPSEVKA